MYMYNKMGSSSEAKRRHLMANPQKTRLVMLKQAISQFDV